MDKEFYQLIKENSEKQELKMKFSEDLFLFSVKENPFNTDILKLLEFEDKTKFCEISSFSLNHELLNRQDLNFLKMKRFGLKLPNFQRAVIMNFTNSESFRQNRILIENNLSTVHKAVPERLPKKRVINKEQIRRKFFNFFVKSPNWIKRPLRRIWKRL